MKQAVLPRVVAAAVSVVLTLVLFDQVARMGLDPEAAYAQAARAVIVVASADR